MPKFKERSGAWGRLTLRVRKDGILIREDFDSNVLTNVGKVEWVKRLYNGTFSGNSIAGVDRMEAGDGGCTNPALYTPIPFAGTDTDLRDSIGLSATLEADPVVDIGNRSVKFVAIFASALTLPGDFHYEPRVINELALKTAAPDNVTVALRAFSSIFFDPTASIEVEAEWEIGLI